MVTKRFGLTIVVAMAILSLAPLSYGQGLGFLGSLDGACCSPTPEGFSLGIGARKYFSSYTTYEFPHAATYYNTAVLPEDTKRKFDYPWDQWLALVTMTYGWKCFEFNVDYGWTTSGSAEGKVQDYEWLDPTHPNQVTTATEYKANPRIWTLDISTTIPCPRTCNLQGIVGYRMQQLKYSPSDGALATLARFNEYGAFRDYLAAVYRQKLAGGNMEFGETYKHWYAGGVATACIDIWRYWSCAPGPQLVLRLQGDVAYVKGNNYNDFLADPTMIYSPATSYGPYYKSMWANTTGFAWHVNLRAGLYAPCDRLRISVDGDYLKLNTTGSNQLNMAWSPAGAANTRGEGWEGGKVTSEQIYGGITAKYTF